MGPPRGLAREAPAKENAAPVKGRVILSLYFQYSNLGRVKWTFSGKYISGRMYEIAGIGAFWGLDKNSGEQQIPLFVRNDKRFESSE